MGSEPHNLSEIARAVASFSCTDRKERFTVDAEAGIDVSSRFRDGLTLRQCAAGFEKGAARGASAR